MASVDWGSSDTQIQSPLLLFAAVKVSLVVALLVRKTWRRCVIEKEVQVVRENLHRASVY